MNNDRELLELAAKAAGIEVTGYVENLGLQYVNGSDDSPYTDYWNPLTDDGDALRLAVNLEMDIHIWNCGVTVTGLTGVEAYEDTCGDRFAETRRAIVRAAAEIGRAI